MAHASKMIGSVQRAIDILNLFDSQFPELGTTEIAKALGLHKSTTASLVYTLEANGYLNQNPNSRKYRLGFRLIERAAALLNQVEIRQIAHPCLLELHKQVDETVNLGVLDGMDIVFVERLLGTKTLGMRSDIGKRAPAHSSAMGKAILSCLPVADVQAMIEKHGLCALTPRTITDPGQFLLELDRVREQGFGLDDEEGELGGRCVAAPIFDHTGQPVAGVSVSVPTPRLPLDRVPSLGVLVREMAKSISRHLGYLPRTY
jgi:IclR family KDG regulon transcriptional repressor